MSLKGFHRVFIAAAIICLLITARWATGRNPALLVKPWLVYACAGGIVMLFPYLISLFKKPRA